MCVYFYNDILLIGHRFIVPHSYPPTDIVWHLWHFVLSLVFYNQSEYYTFQTQAKLHVMFGDDNSNKLLTMPTFAFVVMAGNHINNYCGIFINKTKFIQLTVSHASVILDQHHLK